MAVAAPNSSGMANAAAHRASGGGGASSQPTNWLQPLTNQQVVNQATQTVKSAYQPAFGDLSSQSAQAKSIYAKQQADNQYYQQWLDSKTSALQTQQNQVEQTTNQLEQKLTGNQLAQYGGQADTMINAANARAGNVSSNSLSNAFGSELAQNQAATETLTGGSAQRMLAQENTSQAQLGSSALNAGSFLQAGAQRETSNFNAAMTKIASARSSLTAKEGSDLEREIARLQGVQITVSENNRNYNTAAAKLGISAANVNSEINSRAAQTRISQANLNEKLSQDQIRNMQSDRTYNLDAAKYNSGVAKDLYERQHGLGPYKPGKGGGKAPLSQTSQNTIFSKISTIQGELTNLISQHGLSYQQAWHALHNGTYVATPSSGQNGTPGKAFIKPVGDVGLLNAAYNTLSGYGGGLTTGDVNYLHSLGLIIGNRLPIIPNDTSSQAFQGPH